MGVEHTSGTDNRTETADKPAAQERVSSPPPDNPGSPGQQSRLESLARAREWQENGSQQTGGTETGSRPTEEPASAQPESEGVKPATAGEPKVADRDQDLGKPVTDEGRPDSGEAARQDDHGTETRPLDVGLPADSGTDAPGDRDQPADQQPRPQEAPGRAADVPRDSEQNPLISAGPPDDGHQTRPESAEQPATLENDTGTRDGEPGDHRTTDNTPSSPEEMDQEPGTRELRADQGGDRDKKAEDPETTEPVGESNPPDRDPGQSGEAEEPGRELAPQETNTAEVEEPSRFHGRIAISVDSDGRPIPLNRTDSETDTPGRGELRRPEDDPADRDYNEPDPERRSPGRDFYRNFITKAGDIKKAADKFAEPAQKKLERVQPTGQLCGTRSNSDHIKSVDQPLKAGNLAIGVVGTVVILTEAGRYGIKVLRKVRGSDHASNR